MDHNNGKMSSDNMEELQNRRMKLWNDLIEVEEELKRRQPGIQTDSSAHLSNADIQRYSRHLLLPEFGVQGQQRLKDASVLIVGCGGLGCPAAQYLASSGVGRIGLVDFDQVEISNLHRQVLHSERALGLNKAQSVANAILSLNSEVRVETFAVALNSANALPIVQKFDIILDATDNVASRYLLNDACVLTDKPLVSGSALRFEGQVTVYNYQGGPTYRCLFPEPPPPETVTNCSDGGVLGVVPGIIGTLQALEAIKVASQTGEVMSGKLLLFDALRSTFRKVSLRPRNVDQVKKIMELIDYTQFCGASPNDKEKPLTLLNAKEDRISVHDLEQILEKQGHENCPLLDVRESHEMDICHIPQSFNIPLKKIDKDTSMGQIKSYLEKTESKNLYVICHRGNDSQIAVMKLREKLPTDIIVKDVSGGLTSWAKSVDTDFPIY